MLLNQLRNFNLQNKRKVRVFWDLEETVLDSWDSGLLVNKLDVLSLTQFLGSNFSEVNHELLSYAVFNKDLPQFKEYRKSLESSFDLDFSTSFLNNEKTKSRLYSDKKARNVRNPENLLTLEAFKYLYEKKKNVELSWELFFSVVDKTTLVKTLLEYKPLREYYSDELWVVVDDTVRVEQHTSLKSNVVFLNPKLNNHY